jgi:5-hydroxyisourate hydrolase
VTLSTHVLDTANGEPVAGVPVRLERESDGVYRPVAAGVTNTDGRLSDWVDPELWRAGTYRLVFDTAAWSSFFPEVSVVFVIAEASRHHHVPLLLSPFGYTTYRGS